MVLAEKIWWIFMDLGFLRALDGREGFLFLQAGSDTGSACRIADGGGAVCFLRWVCSQEWISVWFEMSSKLYELPDLSDRASVADQSLAETGRIFQAAVLPWNRSCQFVLPVGKRLKFALYERSALLGQCQGCLSDRDCCVVVL